MKNWRLVVVAMSVVSCGGSPPPEAPPSPVPSATAEAAATVAPPADSAATDKLFDDANEAAKNGDPAAAAKMFEHSVAASIRGRGDNSGLLADMNAAFAAAECSTADLAVATDTAKGGQARAALSRSLSRVDCM